MTGGEPTPGAADARARWVVASGNAHKIDELRALLPEVALLGLGAFPPMAEPVEDAPDFVGNALIKARAVWAHTGAPSLADDSGISVAALGGAPGVHSARWVPGTDRDRLEALLARMAGVADRHAWFTCAVAVAGLPASLRAAPIPTEAAGLRWHGDCLVALGRVDGVLAEAAAGAGGFGYDPIFRLPDGRTLGEVSAAEKHRISHRARAIEPLRQALAAWRAIGVFP